MAEDAVILETEQQDYQYSNISRPNRKDKIQGTNIDEMQKVQYRSGESTRNLL